MSHRSSKPLRAFSVDDLGLANYIQQANADISTTDEDLTFELLDESVDILRDVRHAFQDGFAGVIFAGPPGTSKSHYAVRVALTLAEGDRSRMRMVQFHPSFQYEDFVEGYVPTGSGQFELAPKHLRLICNQAASEPSKEFVLVIDEISRCDAARVFGEALTYIEMTKRGMWFHLSSGTEMQIPPNVVILATMNPWDRGVDDIDLALERRFCHIAMLPRSDKLREILAQGSLPQNTIDAVVRFFEAIQRLPNDMCHIGHAYFVPARDEASLERLWRMQLRHHFERACRLDRPELTKIDNMWAQIVVRTIRPASIAPETPEKTDTDDQ
jgi:5-methylcytosine-specific restriction enzyme B